MKKYRLIPFYAKVCIVKLVRHESQKYLQILTIKNMHLHQKTRSSNDPSEINRFYKLFFNKLSNKCTVFNNWLDYRGISNLIVRVRTHLFLVVASQTRVLIGKKK